MSECLSPPEGPPSLEQTRQRLIWAATRLVGETGFTGLEDEEVATLAGIAVEEMHEHFEGAEGCLLVAYEQIAQEIETRVREAFDAQGEWPAQVRAGLQVILELLGDEPRIAQALVVELSASGPEAQRRYREGLHRLLPFFVEGQRYSERGEELPDGVALLALGGAEAIVFDEIASGRAVALPQMLPELLFALLVPFLGPDEAVAEMRASVEG